MCHDTIPRIGGPAVAFVILIVFGVLYQCREYGLGSEASLTLPRIRSGEGAIAGDSGVCLSRSPAYQTGLVLELSSRSTIDASMFRANCTTCQRMMPCLSDLGESERRDFSAEEPAFQPGARNVNISVDSVYHGSRGSGQTAICSTSAGSNVAVCSGGTADFSVGQGIWFPSAGPQALESTPDPPAVTLVGTSGSTTYCYEVAEADYWGGISAASAATCISNGPSTLTPVNYVKIVTATPSCSYCAAVIYRRVGASGDFVRIAELPQAGGTIDDSNLPLTTDSSLPNIAPDLPVDQNWVTQVTAVSPTTLTLATNAPSTASNVTVAHDDTAATQAAVDAAADAGGGTVRLGSGTYNFNEVSYWNGSAWIYTNPTSEPAANEMYGAVHLASNVWIKGVSRERTTVSSLLFAYVYHSIFAAPNPTSSLIPGDLCATGAETMQSRYPINNVQQGATQITLATVTDASNFKPGDVIFYGGGVVNGEVACGQPNNPSAELNLITSVNQQTGTLHLYYPVTKDVPFGRVGTAPFVEQMNTYTKRNITISDMTIQTLGGGYAMALGDVVHLRVSRVDLPGIDWSGKINIAESRDVVLDALYLRVTADDEYDQPRQVTIQNSRLLLEGGSNQLAFSEGAADISLLRDTFASDDSYCGLMGRCDYGGPNAVTFGPGGANYRVISVDFDTSWVEPGVVLQVFPPADGDTPTLNGVLIRNNVIRANGLSTLDGVNLLARATQQTLENNKIYLNPGSSNSWCFEALTGVLENNYCSIAASLAFQGIVRIHPGSAQTEPLALRDNIIEGPSGQPCIGAFDKRSDIVAIEGNMCNGKLVQ